MRVIRSFGVALLLCAVAWAAFADEAKQMSAIVIAARAELPDSNFKDAVVLVMNNLGPAPAGLIINRPTRVAVSTLFPDLKQLAKLEDKVYFGGPVAIDSVSFLFHADKPPENATQILDGIYLSADEELLRKLLARKKPMEGLRIFVGYSGWGPGQLQNEIGRGDWTLAPANAKTIFEHKSEHPWPERAPDTGPRT